MSYVVPGIADKVDDQIEPWIRRCQPVRAEHDGEEHLVADVRVPAELHETLAACGVSSHGHYGGGATLRARFRRSSILANASSDNGSVTPDIIAVVTQRAAGWTT